MIVLAEYAGLFAVSFLAATIFPAQSEIAFGALLATAERSPLLLLAVASAGNVLGSCTNWLIGYAISRQEGWRWFPVKRDGLARAEAWYHRFGRFSLLLSWMPIIGDPLTIVAGLLREPFLVFLVLVTLAKVGRYVAIMAIVQGWNL